MLKYFFIFPANNNDETELETEYLETETESEPSTANWQRRLSPWSLSFMTEDCIQNCQSSHSKDTIHRSVQNYVFKATRYTFYNNNVKPQKFQFH